MSSTEPLSVQWGYTNADVVQVLRAELHSCIMELVCWAFYTCIYFSAMKSIRRSRSFSYFPDRTRRIHVSALTLMWAVTTARAGTIWYNLDRMYIQFGQSEESEFDFLFAPPGGSDNAPNVIYNVALALNILIADCIIIWRCWVIFGRSWVVVALPILCVLGETACAIIYHILRFDIAAGAWVSLQQTDWLSVYYGMTVATNVLCTGLITYRIVRVTPGALRTYRGVVEILVESAALYAVAFIVFLSVYLWAFFDVNINYSHFYPRAFLPAITGIAPTWVVARVGSGKARPNDSWRMPSFTTTSGAGGTTFSNFVQSVIRFQLSRHSESQVDLESLTDRNVDGSVKRFAVTEELKPEVD